MAKIKKKTFFHYTGKVHDLTVENSHTYNIEGKAVHNSAAGSLIAYVLGITNIDPIEYGLSFYRFLNPARQGFPDIDTDVGDRDLLINLLRDSFGSDNVIPISNYNTFKLKSLIKDISRFYGIPFEEVNAALSTVEDDVKKATFKPGTDKNMFVLEYEDAMKYSKSLNIFIENHPEVADPIKILFKQNRSLGRHAGGVIVSENIKERLPLILAKGEPQTPWVEGMHYKHLEEFGWVKFDLLGLETLRIIERCISLILQRKEGIENPTFDQVRAWFDEHMDPKKIDLHDQHVYKHVYHEGRFCGIFQITQQGAQRLFMKAKPCSIIDIATLTSIYRPGPLGANVDKLYVESKNNKENLDYRHPLIKKVLESSYNCIIFQEQTMALCSVVAGFPESETDTMRRNIMKRSSEKKEQAHADTLKMKEEFITGAVGNGVDSKVASELFENIMKFSGYGFNLSHAASYAVVSYYCAWLLTYFEEEWLCAYLESMSSSDDKRAKAFSEIKAMGYSIANIDINYATKSWTILPGKKFMPSFLSCKGIGDAAIDEVIENRPYASIEELLYQPTGHWRHSKFNKRSLEALIAIKGFDSLNCVGENKTFKNYRQMHEVLITRNSDIKKWTKKNPIAGMENFKTAIEETKNLKDWSKKETIENSMKFLGSFNPVTLIPEEIMKKLDEKEIKSVDEAEESSVYWFIVTDIKKKLTKTKKQYLLITAMGLSGQTKRVFCWGYNDSYELPLYSLCISALEIDSFGCKTFMNRIKILGDK
jgi:DNA polymerase-3 subunit alpha